MTVTIQNVDNTLLQLLKSAVALKPNTYIITEEKEEYISRFDEYREDIKAYKEGKLQTLTSDELKAKVSQW